MASNFFFKIYALLFYLHCLSWWFSSLGNAYYKNSLLAFKANISHRPFNNSASNLTAKNWTVITRVFRRQSVVDFNFVNLSLKCVVIANLQIYHFLFVIMIQVININKKIFIWFLTDTLAFWTTLNLEFKALVLDFMPNGSLEKHLFCGGNRSRLPRPEGFM
eukprot:Gb_41524 [translate_table: standard]